VCIFNVAQLKPIEKKRKNLKKSRVIAKTKTKQAKVNIGN